MLPIAKYSKTLILKTMSIGTD